MVPRERPGDQRRRPRGGHHLQAARKDRRLPARGPQRRQPPRPHRCQRPPPQGDQLCRVQPLGRDPRLHRGALPGARAPRRVLVHRDDQRRFCPPRQGLPGALLGQPLRLQPADGHRADGPLHPLQQPAGGQPRMVLPGHRLWGRVPRAGLPRPPRRRPLRMRPHRRQGHLRARGELQVAVVPRAALPPAPDRPLHAARRTRAARPRLAQRQWLRQPQLRRSSGRHREQPGLAHLPAPTLRHCERLHGPRRYPVQLP
mmetsp:Transcript_27909/g.66299  ORF Transcript_27909/g.66299 Transcript_27909/m.66299 type:complete len:257 (-) Transcript_27909:322-1092(-)